MPNATNQHQKNLDFDHAQAALEACRRGEVRTFAGNLYHLLKDGRVSYEELKTDQAEVLAFLHQADLQEAAEALEHCRRGKTEMFAPVLAELVATRRVSLIEIGLSLPQLEEYLHQGNVQTAKRAARILREMRKNLPKGANAKNSRQVKEARPFFTRLNILINQGKITAEEVGLSPRILDEYARLFKSR